MAAKLTIGPILFHWPEDKKLDFYARIADEAPVDTVYLGEVVCSKRTPFFEKNYDTVADRLKRAGKKVVFSTLAEVLIKRDRKIVKGFCEIIEQDEVEINDVSALSHVSNVPHRVGPYMNVYNEETLRFLASKGTTHVCLPVELPKASIEKMAEVAIELNINLELQVFGRMSLALSARCYHARAHGRVKDNCQFICEEDADGMELSTLTKTPFLSINGIQTLSHSFLNLIHEMKEMNLPYYRLSPHTNDMVKTAEIFKSVLAGEADLEQACSDLKDTGVQAPFSNGFYHQEAGYKWKQNHLNSKNII